MIAVDTNVLVRYVINDDPAQARLAMRVLAFDAKFAKRGKSIGLNVEIIVD